jgi:nucleotide-binding universal stress UspA family protein
MNRERWFVVGMDFSQGAIHAFDYALKLADEVGASVACVHAYEDADEIPAGLDRAPAIRLQMERVVGDCAPVGGRVRVDAVVRRGAPWDKLANVAAELGAELIVVGADGQRGAASDHFLGTVPNRLATTSSRSVLIVPSASAHRAAF